MGTRVAQIASRLGDALRLVTSGRRTVLPRDRTLRATMEWSLALFTPREQALLCRLTVFAGGCTLDAAEAVCGGAASTLQDVEDVAHDVLHGILALVGKSLVVVESDGDILRYHLPDTVRQYGPERRERGAQRREEPPFPEAAHGREDLLSALLLGAGPARPVAVQAGLLHRLEHLRDARPLPRVPEAVAGDGVPRLRRRVAARGLVP